MVQMFDLVKYIIVCSISHKNAADDSLLHLVRLFDSIDIFKGFSTLSLLQKELALKKHHLICNQEDRQHF